MKEILTKSKSKNQNGFTIVEIVIVLVILSILAATVFARFIDTGTFNSLIVRDQIISLARIGQQSSLGRADVTLTITPAAGTAPNSVTLEVKEDGVVFQTVNLELSGVTLTGDVNKLNGSNQTPPCDQDGGDVGITSLAPMIINFDELSDLEEVSVGGTFNSVTSAVRICLNNVPVDSVCISPAGFAYAGSCDVEPS